MAKKAATADSTLVDNTTQKSHSCVVAFKTAADYALYERIAAKAGKERHSVSDEIIIALEKQFPEVTA